MKKITTIIFFSLLLLQIKAQDISGTWNGVLKIQGIELRIIFHITKTDNGLTSTMDSPDQGAKGIPVTSTVLSDSIITMKIEKAGIEYHGVFNDSTISGTFNQSGFSIPLVLKNNSEHTVIIHPQEPVKPYPYISEEITFKNQEDNITLSGTLTLPNKKGNFPAVVLISGSGPQNRDEEIMGHKPFLILSDYLTRNGIAVLRFDDRGTGKSGGSFPGSTTEDFANDANAAFIYLLNRDEINKNKIGLIGHSEGGIIAPMLASKNSKIGFIILLAAPGLSGSELLLLQQKAIGKVSGINDIDLDKSEKISSNIFSTIINCKNDDSLNTILKRKLDNLIKNEPDFKIPNGMEKSQFIDLQIAKLTSPWMLYFLRYNPIHDLEKVRCPVLALNGSKDLQVPPKENLSLIEKALKKGGNKNYSVKELKNLNHLFQECNTGLPNEYSKIDETINTKVLSIITEWILSL